MQPEPAAKTSNPRRRFFILGALFELLLIACYLLPESWLAVKIHNFTLVAHIPLLFLLESGFGETAPTAILILLVGFVVMSCLWGFLIFLVTKGIGSLLIRLNRNQKRFVWFGAGVVGLVCLAWAGISMLPQTPRPFESSLEIKSVVDADTAFALDLYQKLKDKPGNLFFSPYSISSALAMTCAGARGQTEMEMTNALHFSLPPEKLHPAFKALAARMDKIQRWNRIILKSANSLWCQRDYSLHTDFVRLIEENYFAAAKSVDFKMASIAAADEINRWVSGKTDGKIPKIVEAAQLGPATRLALCNAIYFKGKWQHQFKVSDTKPALFHISTNASVTVPIMSQKEHFKTAYSDDGSVELLELPYAGTDLSMIILLPRVDYFLPDVDQPGLPHLEKELTVENLQFWLKELDRTTSHETRVALPRFTTTQNYDLVPELKSLGMTSPFDESANFSGMDGTTNLFVSDVMHKAFVDVNESGTEAAAVTLVLVKTKGQVGSFIVDHPFIFLIRDNGSGSILFLGRIIDPTK